MRIKDMKNQVFLYGKLTEGNFLYDFDFFHT